MEPAQIAEHVAPRLGRPGVEELGEAGPARKVALLELESRVSGREPLAALWDARQLALL